MTGGAPLPAGDASAPPPPGVHVCPLRAEDLPDLLAFVARAQPGFEGPVKRVVGARWARGAEDHGAILVIDGASGPDRIVGYCTAAPAQRRIGGRAVTVCALGSWFVLPEYRFRSLALLARVLARPGVTFVTHTPNVTSVTVLTRFRFAPLDTAFVVFPPLLHARTLLKRPARIRIGARIDPRRLDAADRRIAEDHAPYECGQVFVEAADGDYAYVVSKRRTLRGVPTSDLLYVRRPDVVLRHFEQVKLAVMRADRTALVMSDPRLLGDTPPRGLRRTRTRLFRSETLDRIEIDNLYSEIVLL